MAPARWLAQASIAGPAFSVRRGCRAAKVIVEPDPGDGARILDGRYAGCAGNNDAIEQTSTAGAGLPQVGGVARPAEVIVEIFNLGAPVPGKHPFGAGARRPSHPGIRESSSARSGADGASAKSWRHSEDGLGCRAPHAAIGKTSGAIDQQ